MAAGAHPNDGLAAHSTRRSRAHVFGFCRSRDELRPRHRQGLPTPAYCNDGAARQAIEAVNYRQAAPYPPSAVRVKPRPLAHDRKAAFDATVEAGWSSSVKAPVLREGQALGSSSSTAFSVSARGTQPRLEPGTRMVESHLLHAEEAAAAALKFPPAPRSSITA